MDYLAKTLGNLGGSFGKGSEMLKRPLIDQWVQPSRL